MNDEFDSLGESTDLDISLFSSPGDELWLDYWREFFDQILDDTLNLLTEDGLEDLLQSCPVVVTNELEITSDMEYNLYENRLYVNYERKPTLIRVLEVLGERFFYCLDDEKQESWLIGSTDQQQTANPKELFGKLFADHFTSNSEPQGPLVDLFYQVTELDEDVDQ